MTNGSTVLDFFGIPELGVPILRQTHYPESSVAYNIIGSQGNYSFQMGIRRGQEFEKIGETLWQKLQPGHTLEKVAEDEICKMGDKAGIFDVFINGMLYRQADIYQSPTN